MTAGVFDYKAIKRALDKRLGDGDGGTLYAETADGKHEAVEGGHDFWGKNDGVCTRCKSTFESMQDALCPKVCPGKPLPFGTVVRPGKYFETFADGRGGYERRSTGVERPLFPGFTVKEYVAQNVMTQQRLVVDDSKLEAMAKAAWTRMTKFSCFPDPSEDRDLAQLPLIAWDKQSERIRHEWRESTRAALRAGHEFSWTATPATCARDAGFT